MLQEHIKNLRNEIEEYRNSEEEEVIIPQIEVDRKGGPKNKEVDQKGGPKTREAILHLISEDESITSRDMANKLNINRSAISKHLKKMQDENLIRREGSARAGRWIIISKS